MSLAATADLRRDVRIIGLVGSAHFVSHFFQLALPPLFPLLKDAFGVPYVALGLTMSLFYSGLDLGSCVTPPLFGWLPTTASRARSSGCRPRSCS